MEQTSLFNQEMDMSAPLASRVRPTGLEDFVGQQHLVGEGKFLREIIAKNTVEFYYF